MIVELRGKVAHIDWERELVTLDVHGVGYGVYVPRSTLDRLRGNSEEVQLFTHMHVRDDALVLYGFSTRAERELFELLLTVSGVGPKLALAVLSSFRVRDIQQAVQLEDVSLLTEIPGVGKKTAQRLILELRDRLGGLPTDAEPGVPGEESPVDRAARVEAEEALMALGYARQEALRAVEQAVQELGKAGVEDLVRFSLRRLGSHRSAD